MRKAHALLPDYGRNVRLASTLTYAGLGGCCSDGEWRRNERSIHRRTASLAPTLTCTSLWGCCSDGEPRRATFTQLAGYDRDACLVPTIVMRQAGGVLQSYGRQGLLRCTAAVGTSVTRRAYLLDGGLAVEKLCTRHTFSGKVEHPRQGMASVVYGTPYAMTHAARCLSTIPKEQKETSAKQSVYLSCIAYRVNQSRCPLFQL